MNNKRLFLRIAICACFALLLAISTSLLNSSDRGSLDSTFGEGGIVTTSVTSYDSEIYSAAIQTDGKIVGAGKVKSENGLFDFAVVRYNTNGSLDDTFGEGGIVTTSLAEMDSAIHAIAIQADGKIVGVGGAFLSYGNCDVMAVVRYNTNGSLDKTFGENGIAIIPLGLKVIEGYPQGSAIAIDTEGKIVVAGYEWSAPHEDFLVVRFNTNGSLDTSFNKDGIMVGPKGPSYDHFSSMVIQTDGKIVVSGSSNGNSVLKRYNANGSLDTTFGLGGIVTPKRNCTFSSSLAIQTDGKIIVSGSSDESFGVERYNIDGSLDTTFKAEGKIMPEGNYCPHISSIAIQTDGKIVVIWEANWESGVMRYNTDGSLDTTFKAELRGQGETVAIQTDGKIVIAGFLWEKGDYNPGGGKSVFAVVRYNARD